MKVKEYTAKDLPVISTKIWRPISHYGKRFKIDAVAAIKDGSHYVFRALDYPCLLVKDMPTWVARDPSCVGLVCFSEHPLEDTEELGVWTYLEVTGHAKSGRAVFVKPVYGNPDELFDKYLYT